MNTGQKAATLINLVFLILILFSGYVLLKYAFPYMIPFLISFVFVYISQPLATTICKKTMVPKNLLTIIFLLVIISVVVATAWYVLVKLIDLLGELLGNGVDIENIFSRVCDRIDGISRGIPDGLKKYVHIDPQTVIKSTSEYVSNYVVDIIEEVVRILPGFIFSTIVSIVFACFLAFDYDNIVRFIKRQLNPETIKFVAKVKQIVNYSLFNLLKGYLLLMLLTFTEVFLGLTVIGVKNAFAVAFITAVVDILPVFGTGVILVPWGIYNLFVGRIARGVGILIIYAICAVVRYFAEPKIIGKKVGLSPLVSLVAMFVGLKFFGVAGLIALPFIISIIFILNKNGYIKLWK